MECRVTATPKTLKLVVLAIILFTTLFLVTHGAWSADWAANGSAASYGLGTNKCPFTQELRGDESARLAYETQLQSLQPQGGFGNTSREFGGFAPEIDPISLQCVTCHDGSSGPAAGFKTKPRLPDPYSHDGWAELREKHSIGMDYEAYGSAPRNARGYVEKSALPAGIKFVGGRMACISCHDPYTRDAKMLAVTIERSELCFACHIK